MHRFFLLVIWLVVNHVVDNLVILSDGVYFCLSMFPGCFCAYPQVYAASQDQACAWVNHFVPMIGLIIPIVNYVIMCALWTAIRLNLRNKHGIGDTSGCSPFDCLTIF